jgi:hypothetical protein
MILRTFRALRLQFVAACLASLALLDCSCAEETEKRVEVHPARGQLLHNGKPVGDALVVLRPVASAAKDDRTPRPTGRTDHEGRFRLQTYLENDGAPAGSYLVGISISPAFAENRDLMKNATVAPKKPAEDVLGMRYADPAKSGLKLEIKPGTNEIPTFDLK